MDTYLWKICGSLPRARLLFESYYLKATIWNNVLFSKQSGILPGDAEY